MGHPHAYPQHGRLCQQSAALRMSLGSTMGLLWQSWPGWVEAAWAATIVLHCSFVLTQESFHLTPISVWVLYNQEKLLSETVGPKAHIWKLCSLLCLHAVVYIPQNMLHASPSCSEDSRSTSVHLQNSRDALCMPSFLCHVQVSSCVSCAPLGSCCCQV